MPNPTYATEWVIMARKNLETARVVFDANHYTDIIAVEIHQSIEKSMKAVLAYHGVKIPKTHDLIFLYDLCSESLKLGEDALNELLIINDYYEVERYPGPKYYTPEKSEVMQNLEFATMIYNKVKALIGSKP